MKTRAAFFALALLIAPTWAQRDAPEKAPTPQEQKTPAPQDTTQPAQPKDAKQEGTSKDAPAAKTSTFTKEQLEQLVAPIALYPDSLLAQLLMAATYPLEIVEAARWSQKNASIKGDQLEAALQKETWDPAVKSLCGFPDVLKRMNDNLDWTQDLGDGFLGQKAELMDAVQNMRRKAFDAGNLKSSKELTITEQADKIIIIEAAQPEVIYVPTYYPSVVYGSWSYPYWYYPPMYPPPPAGGVWFGFAAGVVWGAAVWGGCSWGWGHTDVDIDINKQNNFINRTESEGRRQDVKDRAGAGTNDRAGSKGKGSWNHSPEHRKGVGYKDNKVASKYGGSAGQTRLSKDQARGYGDRGGAGAGASARTQPSARPSTTSPRTTGQSSGSFSGTRSPSLDKASSSRGSASRGSGGARGGGGGGGGGRR